MQQKMILIIVALTMFMESLDVSILNTSIPVIAKSLAISPIDLKLSLICYLICLAIFVPISGWVADKYGAKKIFLLAIGVFTLSSIACGFSQTLEELILARTAQGIGASFLVPLGRLIMLKSFARKDFPMLMTYVVMLASTGLMLGPLLGGFIITHFHWAWVFWVNGPIGCILLVASYYFLPFIQRYRVHHLDIIGFMLFGLGLGGFVFALSLFSELEIDIHFGYWLLMGSMLLLLIYIMRAKHQLHPIVKTSLLNYRLFRISFIINAFSRMVFGAIPFLLPLLFQIGFDYSPVQSGLLVAPIALGIFFSKVIQLSATKALGFKRFLIINTLCSSLMLFLFSQFNQHTSPWLIAIATGIYGMIISFQYSSLNALGYLDIPETHLSAATSIVSTMYQVSQSIGVAGAAILLRSSNLDPKHLEISSFDKTFHLLSLLSLFSILFLLKLKREDGQDYLKD
jgi:EmrB/QacA subfamily drug resistance transporter